LTTYDNKTIVIPNSELSNSSITNYSTEPTRLVEWVFGIGYEDDITLAKSVIEEEIFSDQRVKNQNEPFIKISSLGDSSVNIKVRAEVNQIDYWDVLFEYTEKIKLAFDQNKINIPYPQMQIHQSK
jgi:small conductance mechanosensitive channel